MIIRNKQLEGIKRSINQVWQKEFKDRLREDMPEQTSKMSDEKLTETVKSSHENAEELEIFEKECIYRFLKIEFLPKEFLEDNYNQSVLIRILNNTNLSSAERLDFLEQQLISRTKADK